MSNLKKRGLLGRVGYYTWVIIKNILLYPLKRALKLTGVAVIFGLLFLSIAPLLVMLTIALLPVLLLSATHKLFKWPKINPFPFLRIGIYRLVALIGMFIYKLARIIYLEIKTPIQILIDWVKNTLKKSKKLIRTHKERPHVTLALIQEKQPHQNNIGNEETPLGTEDIDLSISNINELITYFQSSEYQEVSQRLAYFGKKIVVKLAEETGPELEKLQNYLLENNILCLCVYQGYPTKTNTTFQNIFYQCKHRMVAELLKKSGTQAFAIPSAMYYDQIRRGKINLARGEVQQGQLEFQRKQEVTQQVELEQTTQTLLDLRREQLKERKAPAPLQIPSNNASEILIRESNLAQYAHHINLHDSTDLQKLQNFWRSLVGENAQKRANLTYPPITDISLSAMKVLAKYAREFEYGLVLDNLPDGFYLYSTETPPRVVLAYNPALKPENNQNPRQLLRILLTKVDSKQATQAAIETLYLGRDKHVTQQILAANQKIDSGLLEDKMDGLVTLLHLHHSGWEKEHLQKLLEDLSLNNTENLQALRNTLLNNGPESVVILLNQLFALQKTDHYANFKKVFIDGQLHYNALTTPEGLQQLKTLSSWNKNALVWWDSLTQAHQLYTHRANFSELYTAFSYFLHRIKTLGVLLPASPPSNIKHMKVALDRMLLLLDAAIDKKEQVAELSELDFLSEGVPYATTENFKLLTKEMECSPNINDLHEAAKNEHFVAFSLTTQTLRHLNLPNQTPNYFVFNRQLGARGLIQALTEQKAPPAVIDFVLKQLATCPLVRERIISLVSSSPEEKDYWRLFEGRNLKDQEENFQKTWDQYKLVSDVFDIGFPLAFRYAKKEAEFKGILKGASAETLDGKTQAAFEQINYQVINQIWIPESEKVANQTHLLPNRNNPSSSNASDNSNKPQFIIQPAAPLSRSPSALTALEANRAFSYSTAYRDPAFLAEMINSHQFNINTAYFFRYVGLSTWALPIEFYRTLANQVKSTVEQKSVSWSNALLHCLSTLTTTQRQLTKGRDTQFIPTLIAKCDCLHPQSFQTLQQVVRGMKEENQPAAQDFLNILELFSTDTDIHAIQELLALIDELGPWSYSFVENAALRKRAGLTCYNPSKLLVKLKLIQQENGGALSLVEDPLLLSYLADIEEADSPTIKSFLLQLATFLGQEDKSLYQAFLRIIKTIQLPKSQKLPTMIEMLDIAKQISEEYHVTRQKDNLAKEIQLAWPQTYILAFYPIESPTVTILKALSRTVAGLNCSQMIQDLPLVGETLSKPFKALENWRDQLLLPGVSLADAFNGLTDVEEAIQHALGGFLDFALGGTVGRIELFKPFFEHKTLAALFKAPIEGLLKQVYQHALVAIGINENSHSPIYQLFFASSNQKELNPELTVAETFVPYFAAVDALQTQLNRLITVHNSVSQAEWQLILTLLETNCKRLSFKQHSELFEVCQQYDNEHVLEDLTIFYETLAQPASQNARFDNAYQALQGLMPFANRLRKNPEQFRKLLQFTFAHCLQQDTPFPYLALFELNTITSEQHSEALSELTHIILRFAAQANGNDNHLQEAIQRLVQLVKGYPDTLSLVVKYLKLHQSETAINWLSYSQSIGKLFHAFQADPVQQTALITILNALPFKTVESIDTLVERLATLSREQLTQLAALFVEKPYPSVERFQAALEHLDDINNWMQQFDKDPFGMRLNAEQIAQHFDTSQVIRIIQNVKDLKSEQVLPFIEQLALAKDFAWINQKGKTLVECSRTQLKQQAQALRDALQLDPDNHTLKVELIALAREIYYRTTGKFANSTQILTVLIYLSCPGNILLQLNTGQGKSIVSPFFQIMEWIKGGGVVAATANNDLAYRDHDSNALFFDFLGVPHQYQDEESQQEDYVLDGVNYARLANVSLYRANAKVDRQPTRGVTNGVKNPTSSLIIDEIDADILDNHTAFNLALGGATNPYAWIYSKINDFVEKADFRNIDPAQGLPVWYKDEDILQLKQYLTTEITDPNQLQMLHFVSDYQYNKWLDAALIARQHREGHEFIIQQLSTKEGKKIHFAVPLDHNIPQEGSTRENGVQQFLHARLQKDKGLTFPIEDESIKVSSEFTAYFIHRYLRKGGRLIGISATLGNTLELAEEATNYAVHAFSIPPHEVSQRKILASKIIAADLQEDTLPASTYVPLGETYLNELVASMITERPESASYRIAHREDPGAQPTLIICKNVNELERFKRALQSRPEFANREINVVRGDEDMDTRSALVKKAGNKNTITLSTSLLGRGTDIITTHPAGLFCIQTYVDNKRTSKQIEGRSARRDQVGYFMCLFETEDGRLRRYETHSLDKLETLYQKIDEEAAVERYYQQEMDGIQNTVLDFFQRWYKLVLSCNPDKPLLKRALLKLREDIITSFANTWQALLEATDPDKQDVNLLIHREADGTLETRSLDECVMALEEHAILQWEKSAKSLAQLLPVEQLMDTRNTDKLAKRYQRLSNQSLSQALEARRYKRGIIPVQELHTPLIPVDAEARLLEALDEDKVKDPPALKTPEQLGQELNAICNELISELSWHTGLGRFFERDVTREAARAIFAEARQPTIHSLYKVLLTWDAKLKNKRFLGLFHPNIKKTIQNALAALDKTTWQNKDWTEARYKAENKTQSSTKLTLEHFAAMKQKKLASKGSALKLYHHNAGFRQECYIVDENRPHQTGQNSIFYKKVSTTGELQQALREIKSGAQG